MLGGASFGFCWGVDFLGAEGSGRKEGELEL